MMHHLSLSDISQTLYISERTIRRYIRTFESTGDVEPTVQRHGPRPLLGDHEQLVLLRIVMENTGIYLHEIQAKLHNHGIAVSVATICRTLRMMGCTRQVIQVVALQRSDYCRAKFMTEVSCYDPSMLIWLDESGFDKRNAMRKHAYGIRGITPQDHRLLIRGTRFSAIPIISTQGIQDVCLSVNGDKFCILFVLYSSALFSLSTG